MTPFDQPMGLHVSDHDPPGTPAASAEQVSVLPSLATSAPGAQRLVLTLEMPLPGSPQSAESRPSLNDTKLQLEDQEPPVQMCECASYSWRTKYRLQAEVCAPLQ